MRYLKRVLEREISTFMREAQVIAVLGPRQCGKSTLIRHVADEQFGEKVSDGAVNDLIERV